MFFRILTFSFLIPSFLHYHIYKGTSPTVYICFSPRSNASTKLPFLFFPDSSRVLVLLVAIMPQLCSVFWHLVLDILRVVLSVGHLRLPRPSTVFHNVSETFSPSLSAPTGLQLYVVGFLLEFGLFLYFKKLKVPVWFYFLSLLIYLPLGGG